MNNDTRYDLIPAYALDALDPQERAEVDALLQVDAAARALLADYQALSDELLLLVPAGVPAPARDLTADLRARLAAPDRQRSTAMPQAASADPDFLAASPPAAESAAMPHPRLNPAPRALHLPRGRVALRWLAVAAVVVLIAAALLLLPNRVLAPDAAQVFAEIAAQPDSLRVSTVQTDYEGLWGVMVAERGGTQAVLHVGGLPDIDADQTFQLWLFEADTPLPGPTYHPVDPENWSGYVLLELDAPLSHFRGVGCSIEPGNGGDAPHPDSQRVFYMPLDSTDPGATPTDCAAPADCPQN